MISGVVFSGVSAFNKNVMQVDARDVKRTCPASIPQKALPRHGMHPAPGPATRCCFPSTDLLRNEGETSSADVPVSDRAHSSRHGTFHHLRVFSPETQVSGLCWLLCWYRRATCERELWLRLMLLACSSLSLPNL